MYIVELTPVLTPTWSETPVFVAMEVYPVRAEEDAAGGVNG